MKHFKFFGRGLFAALTLVAVISMAVSAAPLAAATTKSLSTNYTVVNLGSELAQVSASYVKPDGTPWSASPDNISFTVAENFGQRVIAQYADPAMTAGSGSVVLSSSQPLGAVVQIQARQPQTPTQGAYAGVSSPSSKYFVPQALRKRASAGGGVSSSQIIIQSAEATGTVSVTIDFIPYPGIAGIAAYQKTGIVLQPGASYYYDLSDEAAANLADNWTGSAVVTAANGKQISVVVNTFSGAHQLQTYNAFPQESLTSAWSIPQFVSRLPNGLSTPVVVQNLSGGQLAANTITMNCTTSGNFSPKTFTVRNTVPVASNASYAFNPVADNSLPTNWSGACQVTVANNAGVVVFVQMRRPGHTDEAAAYEAFPTNSTANRVVIPLVSKMQANGFATAVTIQNLDNNNAAAVRLTYTPAAAYVNKGGSATPLVFNATIAAGSNRIENHRISGGVPTMPVGWYGTLLVEPQAGTTPRPVVAFVQLTNYQGAPGDTLMAHNAFLLP